MAENLQIYGLPYSNVTGFKAQDPDGNIITFPRASGTLEVNAIGTYDIASYASVKVGAMEDLFGGVVQQALSGEIILPASVTTIAVGLSNLSALEAVDGINVTRIAAYGFRMDRSLARVSFPACESIAYNAFEGCSALSSVSFPVCFGISSYVFQNCVNLSLAYLPAALSLGSYAFEFCSRLTHVTLDACSRIEISVFYNCSALSEIRLPVCQSIGNQAFWTCALLQTVYAPSISYVAYSAFYRCFHLLSVYFTGSSVASLASLTAFGSTPISNYTASTGGVNGSIFVRQSLLSAWRTSTNWVAYSSRFVGLTDEEIAALPF